MQADYEPIDYASVRASIPLWSVLELLGFEPTRIRGTQVRGSCVLADCGGTGVDFSANLDRNVWYCFACRRGGNQLDLWARQQGTSLYHSTEHLCSQAGIPVPRLAQGVASMPRPATS